MKKTLLILLSLILCLSFTFTACNTDVEFGNDDTNNTEESDKATEDTRPAPSGVDKSIAKNSLNKIDLSTLMGSTENSFDVFADLVAGFELNIAGVMYGEEGNASIKAAFEEGKIYLGERSEGDGDVEEEEFFLKLDGDVIDLFENIDGKWQLTETATFEDMFGTDAEALEETIKSIKIPELKEEYLTEKNGMLVVSNQYVLDVIDANIKLIAGGEISNEEKTETLKSIEEMIKALGVEISIGTGYDKIVKLAVTAAPTAEMAAQMGIKSLKAEIALDDDATYLKSASFALERALPAEYGYTPKYTASLSSIVVDGKLTGFDLKANIAIESYGYGDPDGYEDGYYDYDEEGNLIDKDGNIITEREEIEYVNFSEVAINAKIDISKIKEVGAEVAKLDVQYKPVKAIKITKKLDLQTYEETILSVDTAENDETPATITGTIKTTAENVASISGEFKMGEDNLTFSGSFSYGTVEFPEIPADIKNYFD